MTKARTEGAPPGVERQSNRVLCLRTNMSGIGWFLGEAGRNALLHGRARQVTVNLVKLRPTDREPILEIIDDGVGMDADDRWRFMRLGYSKTGNGTGVRETAATIAQMLEVHTVATDESTVAWRVKMPLLQFLFEVQENRWAGDWERVPRLASRLPPSLEHGTMLVLSDFRTPDVSAVRNDRDVPLAELLAHLRPTAAQINEDTMRARIPVFFPPDDARLFVVNGKRIQPRPYEGYVLWKEADVEKPGLGAVGGEIRLADTARGAWLMMGGSTRTVPLPVFLFDMNDHNPDLLKRVPVIYNEKRLTGRLCIGALDRFPTRDREHLMADFYTSSTAHVAVDELVRIGAKMAERMREYESQPQNALADNLISEMVARLHEAQGIEPGVEQTGEKRGTGTSVEAETVAGPLPRLEVAPAQIRFEPWDGGALRDTTTVAVINPLPDEEFEWQDLEGLGLVETARGAENSIRAIRRPGVHLVIVRSCVHPSREATVQVEVRQSETTPVTPDIFCLLPTSTTVQVGQERLVRIRYEGGTSGKYEWRVEPLMRKTEALCRLVHQPGGREVKFVALREGRYLITCVDRENPARTASCRVEALARPAGPRPITCPPGMVGGGDTAVVLGNVGTGSSADAARKSFVKGETLHYRFAGREWLFAVNSDESLSEPFQVEPGNRRVLVSSRVLGRFHDPEAQRRHVWSCVADGVACIMLHEGALVAEDHISFAELVGDILEQLMATKTANGTVKKK